MAIRADEHAHVTVHHHPTGSARRSVAELVGQPLEHIVHNGAHVTNLGIVGGSIRRKDLAESKRIHQRLKRHAVPQRHAERRAQRFKAADRERV